MDKQTSLGSSERLTSYMQKEAQHKIVSAYIVTILNRSQISLYTLSKYSNTKGWQVQGSFIINPEEIIKQAMHGE